MAEPIPFKESNCTFTSSNPDILDLPTHKAEGYILSKWKLTKPEIDEVSSTGVVWVWVYSTSLAPISISVKDPFKDPEPAWTDRTGWFADFDEDEDDGRWVPVLQVDGCCFTFPAGFNTEQDCLDFIRHSILGKQLLKE